MKENCSVKIDEIATCGAISCGLGHRTVHDLTQFGCLEFQMILGCSSRSGEDVKEAVHQWLHGQRKDSFYMGWDTLPNRWNSCIAGHRDGVHNDGNGIVFI